MFRIEIGVGFPDDLLARMAKQVLEGPVAAEVTPKPVLVENRKRKGAEQGFEQGFPIDCRVLMLLSGSPVVMPRRRKGRLLKRLGQGHHGSPSTMGNNQMSHSPGRESLAKAAQVI